MFCIYVFVDLELLQRQKLGVISDAAIVLAVEDPQDRVGSGGATLNALLVVAEHISAKHKFNVGKLLAVKWCKYYELLNYLSHRGDTMWFY